MTDAKSVVLWGAGAAAALSMRVSVQQGSFLGKLADSRDSLRFRVEEALKPVIDRQWTDALVDLLLILGDGDPAGREHEITSDALAAMKRNLPSRASDDDARERVVELRSLFNWPSLRRVIEVCPREDGQLNVTSVFNIIDMHDQSGHGFRSKDGLFLTPAQIHGARAALYLILQTMFFIDYQNALSHKAVQFDIYYEFALALGRRQQQQGLSRVRAGHDPESPEFYWGDVTFVSFNYDSTLLWFQFCAHRVLNKAASVPHVGSPARRLQLFHDLAQFVSSAPIGDRAKRHKKWHPMNEASAQRLNDPEHGASDRIRLTRFLFPHGSVLWRECPDCGQLSSYFGDTWDHKSRTLMPPPPLKAFVNGLAFDHRGAKDVRTAWDEGRVDARACVHCGTLTHAHHTQTIMQSNFKPRTPPFIEEIQRALRVAVQEADHIILMGYSLPPDDVTYRAFLAARKNRNNDVRCSVIVGYHPQWARWYRGPELDAACKALTYDGKTVLAAQQLLGKDNVRAYFGGIPNVFCDASGRVSPLEVNRLFDWNSV